MELNVLKSTVQFSGYNHASEKIYLVFDVAPKEQEYVKIGDKHVFVSKKSYGIKGDERESVDGHVVIQTDHDFPKDLSSFFSDEKNTACGWVQFSKGLKDDFEYYPPKIHFTIAVKPQSRIQNYPL